MKSLQPTIASTRSCHSLDHPNYALDVRDLKEEGNYIKQDLLSIDLHRVSSETNFNSILKLFRAGKKKKKEKLVGETPAAKDFSMKRPTSSTYGKKPGHGPESSATSETSETQKPSETDCPLDKNILKALNQVV